MSQTIRTFTFTFSNQESASDFYEVMNTEKTEGVSIEQEKVKVKEWLYCLEDLVHKIVNQDNLDSLINIQIEKS